MEAQAGKFKEFLATMQEEWSMSKGQYDQQFGGQKVPEAVYEARLQSAKITSSKSSGNKMIAREHLITKGEERGKVVYDYMTLNSARNLVYVRRWIEMMNYQCPDSSEDIEATVNAIAAEAPDVKIRVTHDAGGYTNADVIELLGTNASSSQSDQTTEAAQATEEQASAKEYTVDDLKTFCAAKGMDIAACGDDADAIIREIKLYTIERSQLTDEENQMLIDLGMDSIVTNGPAPISQPPAAPVEDEMTTKYKSSMIKFCIGQEIAYEETDNFEQLKERIDAFQYPDTKLTKEEIQLLKEIGLDGDITHPAPEPSTVKKVGAVKAVAPQAPASTPAPAAKKAVSPAPAAKVAQPAAQKAAPAAAKKAPPLKKK